MHQLKFINRKSPVISVYAALLMISQANAVAQGVSYEWAKCVCDTGFLFAGGMAVDAAGNVFITGTFGGTKDFDPGPGTANLSANEHDIFLAKYDASGNYLWAFNVGGIDHDEADGITTDSFGNVLITGNFRYTVDFDPGPSITNLESNAVMDIFFAKYDSMGNYLWAKRISNHKKYFLNQGNYLTGYANFIAVDQANNIYVTGRFTDTVDFDPGPDSAILVSTGPWDAMFLAKYDPAGNYLWAIDMGGSASVIGFVRKFAFDDKGNIYLTGNFTGTYDFNPGTGIANLTSNGSMDIFMAKYDSSGNYNWAFNIGNAYNDNSSGIVIDTAGFLHISGAFYDTVDFDPGPDTFYLASNGGTDIYWAAYDTSGNFIRALHIGDTLNDGVMTIAADKSGNIYLTGGIGGAVDLDPGPSTANLVNKSGRDIFVAKYREDGNYLWAFSLEDSLFDTTYFAWFVANQLFVNDVSGYLYMAGQINGTVDFDLGPAIAALTSKDTTDIFIARYKQFLTGMNELTYSNSALAIYPNPAASHIYISGNLSYPANFRIYDLAGRELLAATLHYSAQPVSINTLNGGMYIYRLTDNEGRLYHGKVLVR